jgi:valyl-tRNA synthetase
VFLVVSNDRTASILLQEKNCFERLANSEILVEKNKEKVPENCVSAVIPGVEIFIPFGELVDIEKEIERLQKEKMHLQKEIARVDGMLANERFVAKAPKKVVDEEKEKRANYLEMMEKVDERLASLK